MSGAAGGPTTFVVLAGQRAGVVNPLAARAGVSHKCLVPICGKALVWWVVEALLDADAEAEIRLVLEEDGIAQVSAQLPRLGASAARVRFVPGATSLLDSVLAATADLAGPVIVTTADNVLLTPEAVAQVHGALAHGEAVFALARREAVLAAHPDGQRNFYRFRDGEYANCNIYGLAGPHALRAAEAFRGGGQFMKSRKRMVDAFGLLNIALLALGLLDLKSAARRLSRRFGVTITPTVFRDGALAIDVDNERTFAVCEELLARRIRAT
ncbi:nucleotidyl transferase [Erythrobacteraceae bacterium CFH 75059]|nr:nucleotidyl transferase [Erythrobacteraceae bacterium CFH 75059]